MEEFSNTKVVVNTLEELVTKERLSRRSLRGLPLQHHLEEALQLFIMLKNEMEMKEIFPYVDPVYKKEAYFMWIL